MQEISSITLPTGGVISYTYGHPTYGDGSPDMGGRRVTSRTLTVNGVSSTWTYAYNFYSGTTPGTFPNVDSTRVTAPDGSYAIHYCNDAFNVASEEKCQIVKVESYSASGQLLKVEDTEYFVGNVSGAPSATTTTLYSTVSGDSTVQKLRTETDYDYVAVPNFGNMTWKNLVEKREFLYDDSGANPVLKRRTHFSYLHQTNATYLNLNITDRVTDTVTYDGGTAGAAVPFGVSYSGGNRVAEIITSYDSTTLTPTSVGIPGHDNAYYGSTITARGNPTASSHWLNTTNSWITSTSIFDDLGHVRSTTDPGLHTTNFNYTDAGNWANPSCNPASESYAFLTQTTDALGHRSATKYYPCTGLVYSKRDENDIQAGRAGTTFTYDLLNRPVRTNYADGGHWDYSYSGMSLPYTVSSSQAIDDTVSAALVRQFTFDGIGRVVKSSVSSDPQGATYVDTAYDGNGRVQTVSNPYRTGDTVSLTTTEYDGLGRATKIIPPDGTTYVNNVRTDFGGKFTITTDQAGKQRKIYTDGLGRLVRVDEPGTVTAPQTQSSGSITVNGTEQTHMDSGAPATGWVTLSAAGASTRSKKVFYPDGTWAIVTDSGSVSITVNGFTASSVYSSSTALTQQLLNALNVPASPVTATLSGTTLSLTAKTPGPNYPLSVSWTYNTDVWSTPLYTATTSGATLAGGRYPAVTAYDNGNVSLAVAGYTAATTYDQNSTGSSIAAALANILNSDFNSPVTALTSTNTINLTSKAYGSTANYTLSGTSSTTQGSFPGPSFTVSSTGMSGGSQGGGGLAAPWTTFYTYDTLGNLRCVEQHGTAQTSSVNCSNPDDGIAGGDWRVRKFKYDSLSQLLSAANPESGTITYNYDNDGSLTSKISPAPNQTGSATLTITYGYDALHRLTGKTYSNGDPAVTYSYDQATFNGLTITNGIGRRTGMADASGQTAWTYDVIGRALNERRTISGVTNELTYTYNLDGSAKTLAYPSGAVVTFAYNNGGHLLSAIDSGNNINYATAAGYTPSGALSALTLGNSTAFAGYTIANQYNNRLQPTLLSANKPGGTILSRFYTYGTAQQNNGNISAITDNLTADRSVSYTYDQLNRIATAQSAGTDCSVVPTNPLITKNWGNSYTIDAWGNLTAKPVTKCSSESLSTTVGVDNRLGIGAHDAAGNLLNNGSATFSYDVENRIASTAGVTYVYDGDGVRVKKSGGSSSPTLYWGESFTAGPIAETDLSGTLKAEYVYFGGKRIARRDLPSGAVHYYFSDHLNSTNLVYSASGTLEEDSDFYPYGGERGYTLGSGNHFKFTGKERDTETGLDYFGARYYGSSLGRFLTPDWADNATAVPYADFGDPQSLNLYCYSRNNAVGRADVDGHDPVIGGILGAGAGAAYILYKTGKVYFTGKGTLPTNEDTAKAIATGFAIGATLGAHVDFQDKTGDEKKPDDNPGGDNKNKQEPGNSDGSQAPSKTPGGEPGSRPGQDFTPAGKKKIDADNAANNDGQTKCVECGKPVRRVKNESGVPTPDDQLQRDHIVPKTEGGSGTPDNGQVLCPTCHKDKTNQDRNRQQQQKKDNETGG